MRTTLAVLLACASLAACASSQAASPGTAAAPREPRPAAARRDPNVLTREEILVSRMENALLLIQRHRQEWLRTRSAAGGGEGGVLEPFHVVVYLDQTRMGGPETLRGISTNGLQRAEFVPAFHAIRRWGADHREGAILLTTGI